MLHVESAEYYGDYKLVVKFNDSGLHIADFEKAIFADSRQIVSDLKNISLFKDFCIKNHTVSWANGLEFAPEFIKDCSIKTLNEIA